MTSTTARVRNVAARMERSALGFEAAALAAPCPLARDALDIAADTLHQYARQVMGDISMGNIGEPSREVEFPEPVPEQEPATTPATPEPVPA